VSNPSDRGTSTHPHARTLLTYGISGVQSKCIQWSRPRRSASWIWN